MRLSYHWERRYATLQGTGGECERCAYPHDPIGVADFALTLAGLAARQHPPQTRRYRETH